MIFLVAGLITAMGAGVAITFWDSIRAAITGWLHRHNLEKTALMEAVIRVDRLAVGVRRRIMIRTYRGAEVISEERLAIDQINDPNLRALIRQHGQVDVDVLQEL